MHAASDSFHTPTELPDRSNRYRTYYPNVDPYVAMLGGEFINHGKQQSGTVRVKVRGSNRFVELEEGQQIPVGSVIDTTRGRVTIVAAGGLEIHRGLVHLFVVTAVSRVRRTALRTRGRAAT